MIKTFFYLILDAFNQIVIFMASFFTTQFFLTIFTTNNCVKVSIAYTSVTVFGGNIFVILFNKQRSRLRKLVTRREEKQVQIKALYKEIHACFELASWHDDLTEKIQV